MAKSKTTTGALPRSAGFPGGRMAMSNTGFCTVPRDVAAYVTFEILGKTYKRASVPKLTRDQMHDLITTGMLPPFALVGVDEAKPKKKKK